MNWRPVRSPSRAAGPAESAVVARTPGNSTPQSSRPCRRWRSRMSQGCGHSRTAQALRELEMERDILRRAVNISRE